jgi:hypothetical protein
MATISLDPAGTVEELQTESLPITISLGAVVVDPNPELIVSIESATTPTTVDIVETESPTNVDPQCATEETVVFPGVTIAAAPLSGLPDVNMTGLEDKSLLLYNASQGVWKPSRTLEQHFIIAEQY